MPWSHFSFISYHKVSTFCCPYMYVCVCVRECVCVCGVHVHEHYLFISFIPVEEDLNIWTLIVYFTNSDGCTIIHSITLTLSYPFSRHGEIYNHQIHNYSISTHLLAWFALVLLLVGVSKFHFVVVVVVGMGHSYGLMVHNGNVRF